MKEVAARRRRALRAIDRGVDRRRGPAFAEQVGYPRILKPRDGAGASGSTRVDSAGDLDAAIAASAVRAASRSRSSSRGHEGFYDTLSVNGAVAHDFITHYYPQRPRGDAHAVDLAAVPVDQPRRCRAGLRGAAPARRKVIQLLGLETSATHMEWFFGPKGLKFSEIGCRPPGVRAWDLYNVGNDMDLYREWAMAICASRTTQTASRRYAAASSRCAPIATATSPATRASRPWATPSAST